MRRATGAAIVLVLFAIAGLFLCVPAPQRNETRTAGVAPAKPVTPQAEQWLKFERQADGTFTVQMPPPLDTRSRWQNPAKRVEPIFPATFDGPVQVRSGTAEASARPLHANNASATITADGALIYKEAFPGCDVQYRCTEFKTEEFIIVRELPSPSTGEGGRERQRTPGEGESATLEFAWALDTHGLKPRITPAHSIELCDAEGVPRLRINPPDGKDAAGKRLEPGKHLQFALTDDGVVLRADARGFALPLVIDPTWSSTGTMTVGRWLDAATSLADGRFLVTGGQGGNQTCEIYNSVSGAWSAAASMSVDRASHTATLLNDGKVLVTGGQGPISSADLNSCEVYNPSDNTWSPATVMGSTRVSHQAITLPGGNVLVVGGSNQGTSTSEVYNPGTNGWSSLINLGTARQAGHTLTLLNTGKVLLVGSGPSSSSTACELFDPNSSTWASTGVLSEIRAFHTATTLVDGRILITGGENGLRTCEVYSPATGTWSVAASMLNARRDHGAVLLSNGTVLIAGGFSSGFQSTCELYDSTTNSWKATSPLAQGRESFHLYRLPIGHVLAASGRGSNSQPLASCELYDPNFTPEVAIIVSSTAVKVNDPLQFNAMVIEPDQDSYTLLWEFGDGTTATDSNPLHTYVTTGSFTVKLTITDSKGASSTTSITIVVGRAPTVRFTTSDIVGFVGQPLAFDATFSTDPENAIVSYAWNFGDASPPGSGQQTSKIYDAEGSYSVTLTVTDAEGLSSALTRAIEILPKSQLGLFNSFVEYSVKWDRAKTDKDSLSFEANVNVGDAVIGKDTAVAIEIAGKRYEGKLDAKLRDKSANEQWQVVANTKKQSSGAALLKLKVKKTSLGLNFNEAGAVAEGEDGDLVELDIPVKIEIAGRSFDLLIASEFKFSKGGTRANGSGEGP